MPDPAPVTSATGLEEDGGLGMGDFRRMWRVPGIGAEPKFELHRTGTWGADCR